MLLRSSPSFSLLNLEREIHGFSLTSSSSTCNVLKNSCGSSVLRSTPARNAKRRFVISASRESNSRPILDVLFEPFEEVKKELLLVPTVPHASLARQKFSNQCEAAINEQIKCIFILYPRHCLCFYTYAYNL
ncbi:bacterial non-heme ferritin [Sarracenia purpurea var. burkii]